MTNQISWARTIAKQWRYVQFYNFYPSQHSTSTYQLSNWEADTHPPPPNPQGKILSQTKQKRSSVKPISYHKLIEDLRPMTFDHDVSLLFFFSVRTQVAPSPHGNMIVPSPIRPAKWCEWRFSPFSDSHKNNRSREKILNHPRSLQDREQWGYSWKFNY